MFGATIFIDMVFQFKDSKDGDRVWNELIESDRNIRMKISSLLEQHEEFRKKTEEARLDYLNYCKKLSQVESELRVYYDELREIEMLKKEEVINEQKKTMELSNQLMEVFKKSKEDAEKNNVEMEDLRSSFTLRVPQYPLQQSTKKQNQPVDDMFDFELGIRRPSKLNNNNFEEEYQSANSGFLSQRPKESHLAAKTKCELAGPSDNPRCPNNSNLQSTQSTNVNNAINLQKAKRISTPCIQRDSNLSRTTLSSKVGKTMKRYHRQFPF